MKNSLNGNGLMREIGLFSATILVVANMIGTGIFTTSGFIIQELGDPGALLLCWAVGGVFALSGALCYGELGSMFPRAGGEYVFLRESFGEGVAFLSGWISLIVGFSAPIAAAAIAFSTYMFRLFPGATKTEFALEIAGTDFFTLSPVTLLAVLIIVVFTLAHYHSLSLGTKVQNVLTLFKAGFIVCFALAGFLLGRGEIAPLLSPPPLESVFRGEFAVSLIFVSFAYSGWNAAAYLGGEIKNPGKNIPLALFVGALFVMCVYLVMNLLYIYSLPPKSMSGVLEVGAESAVSLFGADMGRYFAGAIAVGLLSVLSAMIMTGPRVYYAMAKDGVFFDLFGKVSRLHHTPAYSIFLQAALAAIMVVTASFDRLLLYIGFTLSICATMTVIGMMKLRYLKPDLHRGYRTFGYPVTPLIFITGNLWIIYFSISSKPVTALYGLGTLGAGFLFYLWFRARRNSRFLIQEDVVS